MTHLYPSISIKLDNLLNSLFDIYLPMVNRIHGFKFIRITIQLIIYVGLFYVKIWPFHRHMGSVFLPNPPPAMFKLPQVTVLLRVTVQVTDN
jgi:hypothetical protein